MQDETMAPAGGADQGPTLEHKPSPELSALAREARGLDSAPQAAQSKEQNAVALTIAATNHAELHAALTMAVAAALPLVASVSERKAMMLSAIWGEEQIKAIAKAGADVLAMHGINLGAYTGGGWKPYLALAMSLGPCAYGTYAVLRQQDPPAADVVGGEGG